MDFVILKVNGQDVSNSSHEDAVRCFQSAQEPIIVEVLRRQPSQPAQQPTANEQERRSSSSSSSSSSSTSSNSSSGNSSNNSNSIQEKCENDEDKKESRVLVSTAVQTDWSGLIEEEELTPESFAGDEQTNDSFEDFLTQDIDFEEVTLRKSESAEKLGLTVCYSSGSGSEDADTEVYISEIVPESVAARDGRLREGDQILRVNGKDVANKEQTENLFAETKNSVTILVSRCIYPEDDYDDRRIYHQSTLPLLSETTPAYQNSMIEQLIRQQQRQTEDRAKETETNSSTLKAPPPVPSHTNQSQSQPQSQSTTNIFPTIPSSTSAQNLQKSGGKNSLSPTHPTEERKQWLQESMKECAKKMESVSIRGQQLTPSSTQPQLPPVKLIEAYSSHVWSDGEHIYETIPESDSEPIYSSPYEHRLWTKLNGPGGQASQASQPCAHNNPGQTTKVWQTSSKSNSSGEEKDSSSAYNTGESCHSNPLTLELQKGEQRDHHKSTLVLCQPKTPPAHQSKINCNCPLPVGATIATASRQKSQTNRKSNQISPHYHRDRAPDANLPAETMYTNVANLQQTMMLQQQLFKRALDRKNVVAPKEVSTSGARKSKSHGNFQAPDLGQYQFVGSQQVSTTSARFPISEDRSEVQMEWKVKRRADGTRYIARRPVRNRILRNRAIKISEERAGHTTEDDTMSEMKVGRYWSKEERKRQLERARERKQRQQELILQQQQALQQMQQASDVLISDIVEDKSGKKPVNIVELSHKKMARKKTTLDDFTTVQEMLVHGNRVGGVGPGPGGKLMGLLSVTTV